MSYKTWFSYAKHAFSRAGLGLLLTLALGAGAPTSNAQELTVGVSRSTQSLLFYIAESQQYFAREGVKVKFRECIGGFRCINLLHANEVDLVTAGEIVGTLHAFTKPDFAIIASISNGINNIKLIARKSAGIAGPAQLVGKRIGTVLNTNGHYFLHAYLQFHGVDPKSVHMVPLTPEQIPQALEEGKIDAASIWEPFAHKMLSADNYLLPNVRIYRTSFCLYSKREFIAQREADLVKLLRALVRAQEFVRDQPQQAEAILGKYLQLSQEEAKELWTDQIYALSLNQSMLNTIEGQARWAVREGVVAPGSTIPDYRQFIMSAPMQKAAPSLVSLIR